MRKRGGPCNKEVRRKIIYDVLDTRFGTGEIKGQKKYESEEQLKEVRVPEERTAENGRYGPIQEEQFLRFLLLRR